jgi:hypothetical protein
MLFGDKIFGRLMDEFYQTPGQKGVHPMLRGRPAPMKLICQTNSLVALTFFSRPSEIGIKFRLSRIKTLIPMRRGNLSPDSITNYSNIREPIKIFFNGL